MSRNRVRSERKWISKPATDAPYAAALWCRSVFVCIQRSFASRLCYFNTLLG